MWFHGRVISSKSNSEGLEVAIEATSCVKDDITVMARPGNEININLGETDYYPEVNKEFTIPDTYDVMKVKASLRGGILSLKIPFKEGGKGKVIELEG